MPLAAVELGFDGWALVVLAGGLVAMDGSAWPQSMISRPLVAGTVGGAVFGGSGAGFLVGAALEFLSLPYPPFGAARYPELGPAGLMGGAAHALVGGGLAGLLSATLLGWLVGWIGSWTLQWQWRWNARLMEPGAELAERPVRLESRHRWAVRLSFLRGAALCGALLVPTVALVGMGASMLSGFAGNAMGAGSGAGVLGFGAALGAAGGAASATIGDGSRGGWLMVAGVVGAGAFLLLAGG